MKDERSIILLERPKDSVNSSMVGLGEDVSVQRACNGFASVEQRSIE